jgi:hypothetical protein
VINDCIALHVLLYLPFLTVFLFPAAAAATMSEVENEAQSALIGASCSTFRELLEALKHGRAIVVIKVRGEDHHHHQSAKI